MSFIMLGNQRSGTSFLLDLVSQHPRVDTINEPFSMHLDFFREDETVWQGKECSKTCLHPALSQQLETCNYIRELEQWMNNDYPSVRGIKETGLFEKYEWLFKTFHFDQTIIIIRDFRAIINSVLRRNLHRGWWNYEKRLLNYYNYIGSIDDHIVCAELIKRRTNHLIKIIQDYPCHVIKLEELLLCPEIELRSLMNYLRLDVSVEQNIFLQETSCETRDSAYSNFRQKKDVIAKWKQSLMPSVISDVNCILKDQLVYFGYEI